MVTTYKTRGVCSRAINIEVENGIIVDVTFVGGCSGNTQGVAALAKGMKVEEAIAKLEGITKDVNLVMTASIAVEECPEAIKAYA